MKKMILSLGLCLMFMIGAATQASATIIVICNGNDVEVYYDDDDAGIGQIEFYGCGHLM